jgi:hypothetical protein
MSPVSDPKRAPVQAGQFAVNAVRRTDTKAHSRYSDTVCTKTKGVDAAFMQLQRRGWDIHAL